MYNPQAVTTVLSLASRGTRDGLDEAVALRWTNLCRLDDVGSGLRQRLRRRREDGKSSDPSPCRVVPLHRPGYATRVLVHFHQGSKRAVCRKIRLYGQVS